MNGNLQVNGNQQAVEADEWLTVRAALATGVRVGRIYWLINRKKIRAELESVGQAGTRVLIVRPREVIELMNHAGV